MIKKWLLYLMAALALGPGARGEWGSIPPVLRLHVVANSNSAEDQELKYLVRDALVAHMGEWASESTDFYDAYAYAQSHKEELCTVAREVLTAKGADYGASASVGVYPFPKREYGGITFPKGDYYALRVELGSAQGENWWCVLFPPLCLVEAGQSTAAQQKEEGVVYRSYIGELLGLYPD
ncbi:MAG: stage II sporulation protein R [Clostridiales bacterium]|nr:stage II sporulation protein R [Clostridiales bacterium]